MDIIVRESNPRRGVRWRKMAFDFFDLVQPPAVISNQDLDDVLCQIDPDYQGAIIGPNSRNEWVRRLRKSAAHSAMNTGQYFAYTIRSDHNGRWRVLPVDQAIEAGMAVDALIQSIESLRRNQRYLEEGLSIERFTRLEMSILLQSNEYTVQVLENAARMAQTALHFHRKNARSLMECRNQLALPEITASESDAIERSVRDEDSSD